MRATYGSSKRGIPMNPSVYEAARVVSYGQN